MSKVNPKKESIKEIQKSVAILDKMFQEQAINEILYYRALIKLAFDYSENDLYDKAMILLLKVDTAYYRDHFQEDMEASEEFYDKCGKLLNRLKIAGYALDKFKVNMAPAKA